MPDTCGLVFTGSGGEVVLENVKGIPVATRRKEDFLARFEKWIRRKG